MGRKTSKRDIIKLINNLRDEIPHLAIRTTFLVGYPTEEEKEFNELVDFVERMRFDHLGVFTYSPQEHTPSFRLKGRIPQRLKEERKERLLSLQKEIIQKKNQRLKNKEVTVLIDRKIHPHLYEGRMEADAPEIDNVVYVHSYSCLPPIKIKIGNFYKVKITKTGAYEFEGEILNNMGI